MEEHLVLMAFSVTLVFAASYEDCFQDDDLQEDVNVTDLSFFTENENRIYTEFSSEDNMYYLHNRVRFTLGALNEDDEMILFCLEPVHLRSRTLDKKNNETLATVQSQVYMRYSGTLTVETQCWKRFRDPMKCDPEIRIVPEKLNFSIFEYSPLSENFWRYINDEKMHRSVSIEHLNITVYGGSIPPSWVSLMEISDLEELVLSGNNWRRPGRLLGKLPKLTSIELSRNNIEVLDNDTFGSTPMLTSIDISHDYIHNLSMPIEHLQNIRTLNVKGEDGATDSIVFSMSNGELMAMHNLESLNIAHYHVNMNISLVLQDLNLRHISVTYAQLSHIEDNTKAVISPYHALRQLYLHYNHLTTLPPTIFSQLTNVINLKLNNNRFKDCQKDAVGHMSGLQHLDISHNEITQITAKCFLKLRNLQTLDLSWNGISRLEESTFQYAYALRKIKIAHNKLYFIGYNTFLNTNRLQTLSLNDNNLKAAPETPESIFHLYLGHNDITYFTTKEKSTYRTVDLSWNSVKSAVVGRISELNLSYNSMITIPKGFPSILKNIRKVDLGGNNFTCCDTRSVADLISYSKIFNLGTTKPVSCSIAEHGVWDVPVTEFARNDSLCVKPLPDNALETHEIALQIGVPLAILLLTIAILTFVIRHYSVQASFVYDFFRLKKMGFSSHQRYEESSYDAFVCYSGNSFSWIINELLPNLEGTSDRYRLCLHDRDFTLGVGIDRNILASLDKSRRVMFLLTNEFLHSSWGRWELEMANHRIFQEERGYIILIELEPLLHHQLPKTLSSLMSTRTYVKWPTEPSHSQRIRRYWERLRTALGESIAHKTGREADTGRTVMDA